MDSNKPKVEAKVYAVGTEKGNAVLFLLVNGLKMVVPTNILSMSRLAGIGVPVRNE
jgi:hypothetical protein